MQAGDLPDLRRCRWAGLGFRPDTPLEEGLSAFVDWFYSYHA